MFDLDFIYFLCNAYIYKGVSLDYLAAEEYELRKTLLLNSHKCNHSSWQWNLN